MPPNIPERVAVLETIVPTIKESLTTVVKVQEHQENLLNSICINIATLAAQVGTIVLERSRWKDPMLYVTAVSVIITAIAVFGRR